MLSTFTLTKSVAGAAMTRASAVAGIGVIVGMPLWAVCFACLIPSCDTALRILGVSNDLQMGRVDAAMNPAEMVQLHPFRNRAVHQFEGGSMRQFLNAIDFDLPVSVLGSRGNPQDTSRIRFRDGSIPQSLLQRFDTILIGSHVTPSKLQRLGPRDVVASLRPDSNHNINLHHEHATSKNT